MSDKDHQHSAEAIAEGKKTLAESQEGLGIMATAAEELATRWEAVLVLAATNEDLESEGRKLVEFILAREVPSWRACADFLAKLIKVEEVVDFSNMLKDSSVDESMMFEFVSGPNDEVGYVKPSLLLYHVSKQMAEVCEAWANGANTEQLNEVAKEKFGQVDARLAMAKIAEAAGANIPEFAAVNQIKDGSF